LIVSSDHRNTEPIATKSVGADGADQVVRVQIEQDLDAHPRVATRADHQQGRAM
jgi:hypothetical protein